MAKDEMQLMLLKMMVKKKVRRPCGVLDPKLQSLQSCSPVTKDHGPLDRGFYILWGQTSSNITTSETGLMSVGSLLGPFGLFFPPLFPTFFHLIFETLIFTILTNSGAPKSSEITKNPPRNTLRSENSDFLISATPPKRNQHFPGCRAPRNH